MSTTKILAMLGLAGLFGVIAAGCGGSGNTTSGLQSCTQIGCGPTFNVEFKRSAWPAGDVEIVVVADATTFTCSVTLPFASCDAVPKCTPVGTPFLIELSGCALPADQHSITGLTWPQNGPSDVKITVSQDGMMLGTASFLPVYDPKFPNGPDCEPVCIQAAGPSSMTF